MSFRNLIKAGCLAGLAAAAVALGTGSAWAQSYPSREIRVIIGYGPGGVTDVLNRIVADAMGKNLGQAVVVDNRPGAGAMVAATAVKNAAPDGYTLFGGSVSTFHPIFAINSLDASKEFTPISTFALGDWFLYVPTSLKINSLADLAAYSKANAGKTRFSSPSPSNTLLYHMVARRLGFTFENIPYKTSDQTIQALLTGEGTATFNAASGFDPHIQAGKLKAIAVLSPQRSPVRPDVPTAKEQGLDVITQFNIGLWGPKGLPQDIVGKLNAAVRESLKQPDVAQRIRNAALSPTPASPQEVLVSFDRDVALYKEAIDASGYQRQ